MAASRRSSLMRDQWRAEDDPRHISRRRERGTNDHRQISPAAPRKEKDSEGGLRIKGRAVADPSPGSPSRNKKAHRREELEKDIRRRSSRSPNDRRARDEQRSKRPREPSRERDSERPRRRHDSDRASKRRRTTSRSLEPESSDFREDRRRPRSPVYSARIDTFRPRSRSRSRRRERPFSPHRPSRGDYYSSSYPEASGLASRFADSYVPGSRRRHSPHTYKERSSRRRSRSSDRYDNYRKTSPTPRRPVSPDFYSRRGRESRESHYRASPYTKGSLGKREEVRRHPEKSPGQSRPSSRRPAKRHRASRSPVEGADTRASRTKMQQSPTRPIQSVLDNSSHPPSKLQRVPSFDNVQNQSMYPNEAFSVHGMKSGDPHSAHRQPRPPHLNTQHSYSTSPQWTPTSSHHGSPHSGSPFSQGRGGWNGQPQQYQGQAS